MTITAVANDLQTVNRSIPGVKSAPAVAETPPTLPADGLPCAITFPGACRWVAAGMGAARGVSRTYVVRVFVAPVDTTQTGDTFSQAYSLLETFGRVYQQLRELGSGAVAIRADAPLEDLGMVRVIGYAGAQYYAFEYHVPVIEPA